MGARGCLGPAFGIGHDLSQVGGRPGRFDGDDHARHRAIDLGLGDAGHGAHRGEHFIGDCVGVGSAQAAHFDPVVGTAVAAALGGMAAQRLDRDGCGSAGGGRCFGCQSADCSSGGAHRRHCIGRDSVDHACGRSGDRPARADGGFAGKQRRASGELQQAKRHAEHAHQERPLPRRGKRSGAAGRTDRLTDTTYRSFTQRTPFDSRRVGIPSRAAKMFTIPPRESTTDTPRRAAGSPRSYVPHRHSDLRNSARREPCRLATRVRTINVRRPRCRIGERQVAIALIRSERPTSTRLATKADDHDRNHDRQDSDDLSNDHEALQFVRPQGHLPDTRHTATILARSIPAQGCCRDHRGSGHKGLSSGAPPTAILGACVS